MMWLSEDAIKEHHRELLREADKWRLAKRFGGVGQMGRADHILRVPSWDARPLTVLFTILRTRFAARRLKAESEACAAC